MPLYMHCPNCQHPRVVPPQRQGRRLFCRQCGQMFVAALDHTQRPARERRMNVFDLDSTVSTSIIEL